MDLQEATESTKDSKKDFKEFRLEIDIEPTKFSLKGVFWTSGPSTYAKFDNIYATAGSSDKDKNRAKAKALFRLINLAECVLMEEEDDNIEEPNVKGFKNFLEAKKKPFEFFNDKKKMPVFEEIIEELPNGGYSMRLLLDKTVSNISELYSSPKDISSPNKSSDQLLIELRHKISVTGKDVFQIGNKDLQPA